MPEDQVGAAGSYEGVERTPTTKNTPAKRDRGMVCRTMRSGPVIVPSIARPIKKCEMRCSTTLEAIICCSLISSPSSVLTIFNSLLYSVSESVWTGACSHISQLPLPDIARRDNTCGTRPFGIGMSRMPEAKLVHPSRKKSQ